VGDERMQLIAEYPDMYPYFRTEVRAVNARFGRHQSPIGGNLCLINRDTRNWDVADTLASFLQSRLPLLLKTVRSEDEAEVAALEEHQGEPISDYLPYHPAAMLLVDGSWRVPVDIQGGSLLVGL